MSMMFRPVFYRKPDDGKGDGAGSGSIDPAKQTAASGTGNDPGKQTQQSDSNNGNPPAAAITFATEAEFQKKVDELLKDRLERESKKSEEAKKKAAADAAADAAKQNGEWEKVAKQREIELGDILKKVESFDSVQEQLKRYQDALTKNLETQRTGLPDPIIKLLDKLDVAEQLEWLAVNKEAVLKKSPDGVPPTPPANGSGTEQGLKEAKDKFSRDTRNFF
ncbi:MAG: hypothetical protein CVU46_11035 [Chloroflexi bacterium HGW-Chloroflexi-8]|nr:MAG: hypothetical protein CVU46_11035 [Chloroflexi bacterium HGW-Chloroflexi-8]